MKYQTGIQKAVLQSIINAKKHELPYITKTQIINEVKKIVSMKDPENQVGQALYQLQRQTKYRRPRITKHKDEDGSTGCKLRHDTYFLKEK